MNYQRTLIVGAGVSGLETAVRLAAHGVRVVVVERRAVAGGVLAGHPGFSEKIATLLARVEASPSISLRLEVEPVRIRGVAGDFLVTLRTPHGDVEKSFENIVIAAGVETRFPRDILPDMEEASTFVMTHPGVVSGIRERFAPGTRGLLLAGYSGHSAPFSMKLMLEAALALKKDAGMEPLLAVPETIRFDTGWVTDLYRRCREAGVLFFKSDALPRMTSMENRYRFSIPDASLEHSDRAASVEGTADWLLVEPEYRPVSLSHLFWSPHDIRRDDFGFYGEENLHLYPVLSGRAGIYLVGAVTGIKSIGDCVAESRLAVSHILRGREPRAVAVIDENKCAACLTCVRLCPHGAIGFDRVARFTETACFGCGTCVAECPAVAIHLEYPEEVAGEPAPEPADICVFCCEGSTEPAMRKALEESMVAAEGLRVRRLPCTGNLEIVEVLDMFAGDVKGVFVAACQDKNCKHLHGNRRAERRVHRVREILEELGLNPRRIAFGRFASNMHRRLADAVNNFRKEVTRE